MHANEQTGQALPHSTTAGPTVGYAGPDGGMTNGALPMGGFMHLSSSTPPPSEPPEWVKQLAPVIAQQLAKVTQAFSDSKTSRVELDYQEADAARRDSRAGQLTSTSVAIANIAHALADMKEVKARTETTGALEQAISRLASSCVPLAEEKPAGPTEMGYGDLMSMSPGDWPPGTVVVSLADHTVVPVHAFEDEQAAKQLATALVRLGHDVSILTSSSSPQAVDNG